MKYIFDQNLIKQLQEGKIAINYINSKLPDRKERLKAVLREAFPIDKSTVYAGDYLYTANLNDKRFWVAALTSGSSILLDKFFFEPGDTLYNDNNDEFLFVGFTTMGRFVFEEIEAKSLRWYSAERMQQFSKLPHKTKLTKQQIADKFGISVENLEII